MSVRDLFVDLFPGLLRNTSMPVVYKDHEYGGRPGFYTYKYRGNYFKNTPDGPKRISAGEHRRLIEEGR